MQLDPLAPAAAMARVALCRSQGHPAPARIDLDRSAGRGRPPIALIGRALRAPWRQLLSGHRRTKQTISGTETTARISGLSGRSLPGHGWAMQELACPGAPQAAAPGGGAGVRM